MMTMMMKIVSNEVVINADDSMAKAEEMIRGNPNATAVSLWQNFLSLHKAQKKSEGN